MCGAHRVYDKSPIQKNKNGDLDPVNFVAPPLPNPLLRSERKRGKFRFGACPIVGEFRSEVVPLEPRALVEKWRADMRKDLSRADAVLAGTYNPRAVSNAVA